MDGNRIFMKKFKRLKKKNDIFRAIMCLREKKIRFLCEEDEKNGGNRVWNI